MTASIIEKVVKTLMSSIEGKAMGQRALELSNKIKNSISHGGPTHKEMESVIHMLSNNFTRCIMLRRNRGNPSQ